MIILQVWKKKLIIYNNLVFPFNILSKKKKTKKNEDLKRNDKLTTLKII